MHHDEHNPRHPHYREMRHRRENHPNQERERYFNDFQSRWGEPSPPLNLHRNEWHPRDVGRFERQGQFHQEEWLPNQRRGQQPPRQENKPRDISWRQRDVNFNRDNQRAEDRWQQDETIPHPDDRRRRRQGPRDEYGYDERNRR
ncbi:hypothetical protein GCM10027443_12400 [Pontibacter brevis]